MGSRVTRSPPSKIELVIGYSGLVGLFLIPWVWLWNEDFAIALLIDCLLAIGIAVTMSDGRIIQSDSSSKDGGT